MLNTTIDSMRVNRAKRARELEYLKEMANDDLIDSRIEYAESQYMRETSEELLEARALLDTISSEDSKAEEAEINRILESDHDLSFDEMIGLSDYIDENINI